MLDSLYIGATGMTAQQLSVDTIANNLANINTPSFKKARAGFGELYYRRLHPATESGLDISSLASAGTGVRVAGVGKTFTDGELKKTEAPLDLAIRGRGFFEVMLPDGSSAFTRNGSLQVNRDGYLATLDGDQIRPAIQIPPETKDVLIDSNGRVTVLLPGERNRTEVGQIELANFVNPAGLNPIGDSLYLATDKSGDATFGKPADEGFGTVVQGFLESSNVKLVEELVNLVVAQRAYEANAKVLQAADDMLSIVNNLRR